MVAPDAVVRLRPDVRFRVINGEAVVLVQSSAEVMALNEVGSRALELVDGSRSVAAIVELLLDEFEVARAELERDVAQFIEDLHRAGVVELSNG